MADTRVRELERQWQETGTREDEVRYLRERVRMGHLDRARLDLAAYLGYGPAREVAGSGAPVGEMVHVDAWSRALDDEGKRVLVRSLLLVMQPSMDRIARRLPAWKEPGGAGDQFTSWTEAPGDLAVGEQVLATVESLLEGPAEDRGWLSSPMDTLREMVRCALGALRGIQHMTNLVLVRVAAEHRQSGDVQDAYAPLIRWALEYRDTPVLSEPAPDDPDREVEYFRVLVHRGDVSRERLELLAHLQDPAALRVLGDDAPPPIEDIGAWIRGLERWGPQVVGRAAVMVGLAGTPVRLQDERARELRRETLSAAFDCFRKPGPESQEAARESSRKALAWAAEHDRTGETDAGRAVLAAAHSASGATGQVGSLVEAVRYAAQRQAERRLRREVREGIKMWAIGMLDIFAVIPPAGLVPG